METRQFYQFSKKKTKKVKKNIARKFLRLHDFCSFKKGIFHKTAVETLLHLRSHDTHGESHDIVQYVWTEEG